MAQQWGNPERGLAETLATLSEAWLKRCHATNYETPVHPT